MLNMDDHQLPSIQPLESGSAPSQSTNPIQNHEPQFESRLSCVEFLHWLANCPHALESVAKTSIEKERIQALLLRWQAAGCPDPEPKPEKSSPDT